MSTQEQIAKLQALLKRVGTRAAEPRPMKVVDNFAHAAPPAAHAAPPPPPAPVRAPPPMPAARIDLEDDSPPTPTQIDSMDIPLETLPEPVIEVSRASEQESIERIKAAPHVEEAGDEATQIGGDRSAEVAKERDSAPQLEVAAEEMELAETIDVEEPAPLSSRRPVAAEPAEKTITEMTFGEEPPPPRHTPPPESGKLPAAPALDFDADVTGVREAAKLAPPPAELPKPEPLAEQDERAVIGPAPTRVATPPPPPVEVQEKTAPLPPAIAARASHVERKELAPEVTRPAIEPTAPPHDFVGEAAAFKPKTFGELLDATLGL